jgi:hypothetical protein
MVVEEAQRTIPDRDFQFQQHLFRHRQGAYDGRLLAAAAVLDDMDDDDFRDFRVWLVSRGKTIFDRCLEDPEVLAEVVQPASRVTAHGLKYPADSGHGATLGGAHHFSFSSSGTVGESERRRNAFSTPQGPVLYAQFAGDAWSACR